MAAPPVPAGPVTLDRLQQAWPQVLAQLENVSRSSWMLASGARTVALDDDVLTLAFSSQSDVAKFKQLAAGKGPSEDLRQAILAVLGIRVKYIARHDAAGGSGGAGGPAVPAPSGLGREAPRQAAAPEAPAARSAAAPPSGSRPAEAAAPRASAPAAAPVAPRATASAAPRPTAPAAARPTAPAAAPASAAPVTDWAVAPIPSDDDAPAPDPGPAAFPAETPAQFAVDDEPEDAEAATARVATLAPPREGEILPRAEVAPTLERDDDDEDDTDAVADLPVPPTVVPPLTPVVTTRNGGVQRYGEAVVRQVLGATFVREEPYEPPTRFS